MTAGTGDAVPYGVTRLPDLPSDPKITAVLQDMAAEINGFVYPGERLEGVVGAVKWLRAHPEARAVLFGDPEDSEPAERRTGPFTGRRATRPEGAARP
jgi:hypothetical protein